MKYKSRYTALNNFALDKTKKGGTMEALQRIKSMGWNKPILPNAHKLDADDFKEFCDGMLSKMSKPAMRKMNDLFTNYVLDSSTSFTQFARRN